MGQINAANHVSVNLRKRTRRWIKFKLQTIDHIASMPKDRVNSWAGLVLWAGTTPDLTAADLLPRFRSLSLPPANVMQQVEDLVATIKAGIGPLPVNKDSLTAHAEQYLPWLRQMLLDYEQAAVAGEQHPPLFTLMPQISDQMSFIAISSSGLHRYGSHTYSKRVLVIACAM